MNRGSGNVNFGSAFLLLTPLVFFNIVIFLGKVIYGVYKNFKNGEYVNEQGEIIKINLGAKSE